MDRAATHKLWNFYTNYVRAVVLPNHHNNFKNVSYWRDEIFLNILTFLVPLSITALIPGMYMSFRAGIPVVAFADLASFFLVIFIMVCPGLAIWLRKFIFIFMLYGLSVILLYYIRRPGPGLLFLLTITIFSSLIYSYSAAYYSFFTNAVICICFGFLIHFKLRSPLGTNYDLGEWIAISSNLIFLSFLCAECLNWLLRGLKTSLDESKTLAANLTSIIDSTESFIYSLDRDLRFITFNKAFKSAVKTAFDIEIHPGGSAIDIMERSSDDLFWNNVYGEALMGKEIKFEKDFSIAGNVSTSFFLINPIVENNQVTGLSCFASDITERKNSQREIQKLNDELEVRVMERTRQLAASNKEMEAFSFSVSHDLRAPLRAVNGYARMLKEDYGPQLDAEAERIIGNIINYGNKMGQLIDDLLTFSRMGRKEVAEVTLPIPEMVENICREIEAENPDRYVQFNIKKLLPANGDFTAINQVWVNLISNAVKYTRQKKQAVIEIGSEIKGEQTVYYVKDNGAGFDMRYADKLFGVFQRLHSEEEFEGNGVGLAMVQRIISKHGGSIWAEAKVNEGASFYFTLA